MKSEIEVQMRITTFKAKGSDLLRRIIEEK